MTVCMSLWSLVGTRQLAAIVACGVVVVDSQIRREMRELRMRGVIRGNHDDASKRCSLCCKKFVWLLNTAHICVQCSHRVCDKCCQQLQPKRWICCLCLKQLWVHVHSLEPSQCSMNHIFNAIQLQLANLCIVARRQMYRRMHEIAH